MSDSKNDYSKLIKQIMDSLEGVKGFFALDVMPDPKENGIIAYGSIVTSIEDVTSKNYLDTMDSILENEKGFKYLCTPVYVNNNYSVYYIVFEDLLSYQMYCIFMKEKFDPLSTIPDLLN